MSSPTASASNRSDVIGVRRSCETAATRSRRAASDWSRAAFSASQPRDHRVRCLRQLAQLIAGAGCYPDFPLAPPDGDQAVADRIDVVQDPVCGDPRCEHRHEADEQDDHRDQRCVVSRDEHQQADQDEREQHGRDDDRDRERELAGQRTGAAAGPSERDSVPCSERGRGDHDQYRERLERARASERSHRDHASNDHGRQYDQPANRCDPAHGWNRYPTPQTVWMCWGWPGSSSIFARSRRICTVTVEVSV